MKTGNAPVASPFIKASDLLNVLSHLPPGVMVSDITINVPGFKKLKASKFLADLVAGITPLVPNDPDDDDDDDDDGDAEFKKLKAKEKAERAAADKDEDAAEKVEKRNR